MLRIYIGLLLILFGIQISFCQLTTIRFPPGHNKIYQTEGDHIDGAEGSPYLTDKWITGNIALSNGSVIESLPLRYNVFRGEFHFKHADDVYVIESPDSIDFIEMDNKKFTYLLFRNNKGKVEYDYFEVLLENGESKLLLRHTVTLVKSNYNVALNTGDKNDHWEHKNTYYLKKSNEVFLIRKNEKYILKALEDENNGWSLLEKLIE